MWSAECPTAYLCIHGLQKWARTLTRCSIPCLLLIVVLSLPLQKWTLTLYDTNLLGAVLVDEDKPRKRTGLRPIENVDRRRRETTQRNPAAACPTDATKYCPAMCGKVMQSTHAKISSAGEHYFFFTRRWENLVWRPLERPLPGCVLLFPSTYYGIITEHHPSTDRLPLFLAPNAVQCRTKARQDVSTSWAKQMDI